MATSVDMHPVTVGAPRPAPAGEVSADAAGAGASGVRPVPVFVSPVVPADGAPSTAAAAAAAAALTPSYAGVLYLDLDQHGWPPGAVLGRDDERDHSKMRQKWLDDMRGWLMVLAVLAASVTYQAAFNPPGGFWQQDDDQGHVAGTPVLQSKFPKRYTVFFYFNSTAFVTSVVIIVLLMNESFYHSEAKVQALEIIVVLDMAGLMGAYIAGCTREVSSSIYIIILTVAVFLYVVYSARFLPKLWGLVLRVPSLRKAAQDGALPVPRQLLDEARPAADRTRSAPPP